MRKSQAADLAVAAVTAVVVMGLLIVVAAEGNLNVTRRGVLITLYSVAGMLELAGVVVTVIDIRDKNRWARQFAAMAPPPATVREVIVTQAAAARGGTTWGQLEHVGQATAAALDTKRLAVAALLLMVGIIVGVAGNLVSVTG